MEKIHGTPLAAKKETELRFDDFKMIIFDSH